MTPQEQAQARYEAKVREIAEEMAREEDTRIMGFDRWGSLHTSNPGYKRQLMEMYIPAARIAVKHMAEEYKAAYDYFYDFVYDITGDGGVGPDFTEGLQSRGLVPAKQEE